MQDFCFYSTDESSIVSALASLGLTITEDGGAMRPMGDYLYAGNGYAIYRATEDQVSVLEAATWPEGVSLVDPPAGIPLFGGEWLQPELAALQAEACARIDAAAEDLCNNVVTPGSAQMARYTRKQTQAQAFLADAEPTADKYPAVYGEVGITADTAQGVAEAIISRADAWWAYGDAIERVRLAGKQAIQAAGTVSSIRAAEAAVVWPAG